MSNERFDFKQFYILQDRCAMKVGTDGVLLGAWGETPGNKNEGTDKFRVLDIGTGTGLIAMMSAQRLTEKLSDHFLIDAIEIDAEAAAQALENITQSPWKDNINVIHTSLQDFAISDAARSYHLIVSNPPFYNATLKPEDEARSVARHKDSLPVAEIMQFAQLHLTPDGELRLIYPTDYDSEVMTAATLSQLHPLCICDIVTKEGKAAKRRMISLALTSHPKKEIIRQTLCIRNKENAYTTEYLRLVQDFYLQLHS